MKWSKLITCIKEGFKKAQEMKLDNIDNWTPLLMYIHVSRLVFGVVFGVFWVLLVIFFHSL
jgi:hypothetical protein